MAPNNLMPHLQIIGETILDRYRIDELIGIGGLSHVYRAHDLEWNLDVAIKILRHDVNLGHLDYQSIWNEATMTSALSHPHIVSVFNFGEFKEGGFIVMELLLGETLDHKIARGPLQIDDWCNLAKQSLSALDHAHVMKMIHLDIKPSNFMIINKINQEDGLNIKLMDFGISQYQSQINQNLEHQDSVMGSIFYVAPELLERNIVDVRADLYSLGNVLFHALCGVTAIADNNLQSAIESHCTGRLRRMEALRADIHPQICTWVHRLMSLHKEDRHASAAHALEDFNALTNELNLL